MYSITEIFNRTFIKMIYRSFASKSTSGGATKVQNQGTSIKVDKVGTEANKHLPKPSKISTKATYRTYQSTQSNPRRLPSGYNPPTAYSLFVYQTTCGLRHYCSLLYHPFFCYIRRWDWGKVKFSDPIWGGSGVAMGYAEKA